MSQTVNIQNILIKQNNDIAPSQTTEQFKFTRSKKLQNMFIVSNYDEKNGASLSDRKMIYNLNKNIIKDNQSERKHEDDSKRQTAQNFTKQMSVPDFKIKTQSDFGFEKQLNYKKLQSAGFNNQETKEISKGFKDITNLIDEKTAKQRQNILQNLASQSLNCFKQDKKQEFILNLSKFQEFIINYTSELKNALVKQCARNNDLEDQIQSQKEKIKELIDNINYKDRDISYKNKKLSDLKIENQQLRKNKHIDQDILNAEKIVNQRMNQYVEQENQQITQMMQENNVDIMEQLKQQVKYLQDEKNKIQQETQKSNVLMQKKIDSQYIYFKNAEINNKKQIEFIKQLQQYIYKFERMIPLAKYNQLQEIAMMQLQDFQSLQNRCQEDQFEIQRNRQEIKVLTTQLRSYQLKVIPEQIQTDLPKISKIYNYLYDSEFNFQSRHILDNHVCIGNLDQNAVLQVDLKNYQYFKPPFQKFYDEAYQKYVKSYQPKQQINYTELQILRFILDAKYYECMSSFDTKNISRFPEFCYSWLNTFQVDQKEIKVIQTKEFDEQQILELYQFIIDQSSNLWEVLTFREFLDEKATTDEIYYYLQCRFILCQGAQLDNQSSKFEIIAYINFQYVVIIAQSLFSHLEQYQVKTLMEMLNKQTKKRNNIKMIDLQFVLRIFLEYYRKECQLRFSILEKLFHNHPQTVLKNKRKCFITFKDFQNFIEVNFPNTPFIDQSRLYRDCCSIGQGQVSCQVFYTVANESNFFLKLLRQRNFMISLPKPQIGQKDIKLSVLMNNLLNQKKDENKKILFDKNEQIELPVSEQKIEQFKIVIQKIQKQIDLIIPLIEAIGFQFLIIGNEVMLARILQQQKQLNSIKNPDILKTKRDFELYKLQQNIENVVQIIKFVYNYKKNQMYNCENDQLDLILKEIEYNQEQNQVSFLLRYQNIKYFEIHKIFKIFNQIFQFYEFQQ